METRQSDLIKLKQGNLLFARVNPETEVNFFKLSQYDALFVEETSDAVLLNFIDKLRSHPQPTVYLKPIFLYNPSNKQSKLSLLFDGEISTVSTLDRCVTKVVEIKKAIEKIKTNNDVGYKIYKVAICDNDKEFLHAFSNMVRTQVDFQLEWTAQTMDEAYEKIASDAEVIDVLFCQVNFSDSSGEQFLNYAKESGISDLILLSNDGREALHAFEFGVTDLLTKPAAEQNFNRIRTRLARKYRPQAEPQIPEDQLLARKVLNYMYSRQNKELLPIDNAAVTLGFVYPMLSVDVSPDFLMQQLQALERANAMGYLDANYHDSVYVCNICSGGVLHYRETCTNCKSSNLEQEDLIHHFRCAYVGPISDFKQGDSNYELVCPKCYKKLQHIGVDYDKPAVIYNCLKCQTLSQDPVISAKCINCGNDDSVEHLIKHKLYSYKITAKGIQAVEGKRHLELAMLEGHKLEKSYFFRFLIKEINRSKEADFESCIACIDLKNSFEWLKKVGIKRANQIQQEIFEIFITSLPASAEINNNDPAMPIFIVPEKGAKSVITLLTKIKEQITRLLQDNFNQFNDNIVSGVIKISKNKSPREHIELLNEVIKETR